MSRYDDNAGPARPARYHQPDGEYVPPKAAPRRPGADDALALPLSTTRRKQNMPPKILEEHTVQERRDKLRALLRYGPKHRSAITKALHIAKGRTLDNLLTDLKSKGEIVNDGEGTWSLVGPAANEPPERAGTRMNPGPDHPVTEPTGDKEDDPSPAADGDENHQDRCADCGEVHHPGEGCEEDVDEPDPAAKPTWERGRAWPEMIDAEVLKITRGRLIANTPDGQFDPARVGLLSDGSLLLESEDGALIEISPRGGHALQRMMDTNRNWLRRLEHEAQNQ